VENREEYIFTPNYNSEEEGSGEQSRKSVDRSLTFALSESVCDSMYWNRGINFNSLDPDNFYNLQVVGL
jgi:hypothetical protein